MYRLKTQKGDAQYLVKLADPNTMGDHDFETPNTHRFGTHYWAMQQKSPISNDPCYRFDSVEMKKTRNNSKLLTTILSGTDPQYRKYQPTFSDSSNTSYRDFSEKSVCKHNPSGGLRNEDPSSSWFFTVPLFSPAR